ncbi:MAG: ABC transporter permease [Firmicutes bacterium]|nr:ABC transporter permease [Bacillota bacterium]
MKRWANTGTGPNPAAGERQQGRRGAAIRRNLPTAGLLLLLVACWELACRIFEIPPQQLPAPSAIGRAFFENFTILAVQARASLAAAGAGLLMALLLAVLLAVAMDRSPLIKRFLYPLLVISQTVPIYALAPLFLIWFGLGLFSKVVIVSLVCFFPLAVNLVEGLEQVDPEALELLRTMQAGPWLVFRSLQLPSVLPYFFSGLKIAVTYSVIGAVIGEWIGARAGLGVFMLRSLHAFKTAQVFAAIIAVVLLSLLLFKLTELLAWLAMPWNRAGRNNIEEE